MHNWSCKVAAAAMGLCIAGCQSPPPTSAAVVGELRAGSGLLNGYLRQAEWPNSRALLPPPPAQGSPQAVADLAAHRAAQTLRDGPQGRQAAIDAPYGWPHVANTYACELGLEISDARTPHLSMLLRRTQVDAAASTYGAKMAHQRARPYVALSETTCRPDEEDHLRKDGSYPSGHASFGWAWALILSELVPDRQAVLLQRGLAFGQGRVTCGYHWQSDVDAGRLIGAATVARLHADAVFTAQAALARQEIAAARAAGAAAPAFCAAR